MELLMGDAQIAIAPEPSGGVVLKIAHEKLPFTMWIPLEKDRATMLVDAMVDIMKEKRVVMPNG